MDEARFDALRHEALAHMDGLYGFAMRLTGNRQDAEDLVQDTYLKAMRGLGRHREGSLSRAWLYRILTNAYIDRYRRDRRSPVIVTLDEAHGAGADPPPLEAKDLAGRPEDLRRSVDRLLHDRVSDKVKQAIESLPEPLRLTVVLRDVAGLTYKEIAETLGVPIGTVMSRLHRGRRALKDGLLAHAAASGFARRADPGWAASAA